jgi:hypothetical protein
MAATDINDLIPALKREINVPGFELFPGISAGALQGYIQDGFWEGRLSGLFEVWTVKDGADLVVPTTGTFITNDDEDAFPSDLQMFVVILSGFRMIQRRAFNLAQNLRVVAGPTEYEVQISATVLRELVQSLERRINELTELHSDLLAADRVYYLDGVAQSTYSIVNSLPDLAVVL